MPSRSVRYSIDSSALIHGWRRAYRPKNFASVWARIDGLIESGHMRASIEVYHEISKKDDELFSWCKDRKSALFLEIDDACQVEVARLMGAYPRLVDTRKGRSGADPFVIATAIVHRPRCLVVTEESAGGVRIPDVCAAEGIKSVGLADLIDLEDWRFP